MNFSQLAKMGFIVFSLYSCLPCTIFAAKQSSNPFENILQENYLIYENTLNVIYQYIATWAKDQEVNRFSSLQALNNTYQETQQLNKRDTSKATQNVVEQKLRAMQKLMVGIVALRLSERLKTVASHDNQTIAHYESEARLELTKVKRAFDANSTLVYKEKQHEAHKLTLQDKAFKEIENNIGQLIEGKLNEQKQEQLYIQEETIDFSRYEYYVESLDAYKEKYRRLNMRFRDLSQGLSTDPVYILEMTQLSEDVVCYKDVVSTLTFPIIENFYNNTEDADIKQEYYYQLIGLQRDVVSLTKSANNLLERILSSLKTWQIHEITPLLNRNVNEVFSIEQAISDCHDQEILQSTLDAIMINKAFFDENHNTIMLINEQETTNKTYAALASIDRCVQEINRKLNESKAGWRDFEDQARKIEVGIRNNLLEIEKNGIIYFHINLALENLNIYCNLAEDIPLEWRAQLIHEIMNRAYRSLNVLYDRLNDPNIMRQEKLRFDLQNKITNTMNRINQLFPR